MTKPTKPVIHARDHEFGGLDVVGIVWEIVEAPPETGVNDATIDGTFTNYGVGTNIGIGTFTDGTSLGYWSADDGANMHCGLAGTWHIELDGAVAHTGSTVTTFVALTKGGTDLAVLVNASLAAGSSTPFTYSDDVAMADGDTVYLRAGHAGTSGDASSTVTGTILFTLLP